MQTSLAPPLNHSYNAPQQTRIASPKFLRQSLTCSGSCPICFEVAESRTSTCSPSCAVCKTCFQKHVRVTLESTIPGILPRVRCPMCLARLSKHNWCTLVSNDLTQLYKRLCEVACSFLPPCCHDPLCTQLPKALKRPQPRFEQIMDAQVHEDLPQLRSRLELFVKYKITARDVIACIDGMARRAGYTDLLCQDFVDLVATRILDEERRASLILAYHSRHKLTITRCCFAHVCFNCKREWDSRHSENPDGHCDRDELSDCDVVQCRSCRVTLVKVEGCNAVTCPCGFAMDWSVELDVREKLILNRIPTNIDIYDIEGFRAWDEWRGHIKWMVLPEVSTVRAKQRRAKVDHLIRIHSRVLRCGLQRLIWWKRFRERISDLERDINFTRLCFLTTKLRRNNHFRRSVRTYVSVTISLRLCLRELVFVVPRYDEESLSAQDLKIECGLFW